MEEKRKFPRFPLTAQVMCSRYGRQMTMHTLNMSRGGLKLEANFDIGEVGQRIDFAILEKGVTIQCKGTILAVEEFGNKVQARLGFTPSLDWEHEKLSHFLYHRARRLSQRVSKSGAALSLWGTAKKATRKGLEGLRGRLQDRHEDSKVQMVNSWLTLLTDVERTVISLRFGFEGGDPLSLELAGERLGLIPETVRRIEAGAIEKLRKISKKKEIDLEDVL